MNTTIIKEFEKLQKQIEHDIEMEKNLKTKTSNIFRLKQIDNAIKILKTLKYKIKSGDQLKDIKGFGKGIMNRIDEIIKNGYLKEITLKEEDYENTKIINDLKEIYGIGDKIANELVSKHNVKNVKDLKEKYDSGKIKLSNNIVTGLKYYKTYKQQIPRSEMKKMEKYLINVAKQIDSKINIKICGSYRRKKPFSNDIDCMLSHPKVKTKDDIENKKNYLHLFIEALKTDEFIVDSLTGDDVSTKFMGFCQFTSNDHVRRIDIRYIPMESYHTALLYFTGSGSFNQNMRQIAKKKGYKLNEYGLYKLSDMTRVNVKSEEDVFKTIDMEYIEPKDRI